MNTSIRIPVAERHRPSMPPAPIAPRRDPAPGRTLQRMAMSAVRERGLVVFHDGVYDVAAFARRHPGGDFLAGLAGQDVTFALENAHGKNPAIRKMLRRLYVAPFDETTRDPVDRDVLALRERFHRDGLFDYGRARLAFDLARWAVLFGSGIALLSVSTIVSFVLVLAATVDVVWWIHDAGHDAVFEEERTARRVIEALGIIVLGMPQQGYHYGVHRVHHGFTNVVGVDRALETGPLSWDAATAATKPALFRRARLLQWFGAIVPAAGPALLVGAIRHCMARRQRGLVAAVVLRWVVVVALCLYVRAPLLVVTPWVAGSILAFMAGLNHFHLPMSQKPPQSYARAVFERTQNIARAGRFWHWIAGGLDLHIEHHLFPTMPSYRYRKIEPHVRALAERHGLPYRATTRLGAIAHLVRALVRPIPRALTGGPTPKCPFHGTSSRNLSS
jgi:fatty acid desaturase